MIQNRGYRVSPRKTMQIRELAQSLRVQVAPSTPWFPILRLIETLHRHEQIEFEVVEISEMEDEYGLSYPKERRILIREDVYDLAREKNGFARSTIAHELGHIIMHSGEKVAYAREVSQHKVYEDSEWQANKFAQELLIDVYQLSENDDEYSISDKFGVTFKAAQTALASLRRSGDFPAQPYKKVEL